MDQIHCKYVVPFTLSRTFSHQDPVLVTVISRNDTEVHQLHSALQISLSQPKIRFTAVGLSLSDTAKKSTKDNH